MDGYKEVEKIDETIRLLLESDPITLTNSREWRKFIRTLDTSVRTLYDHLHQVEDKANV